ncbi:hypothetical protein [Streptomyces milbemycinicus]|uniref:hypothetical protein n=1 Tax=Streptomyces milbemycinicus TaxID=476552 RepID=UPI0033F08870
MPKEWTFTLALNRQITSNEANLIDTTDNFPLFIDGSVSYTRGGMGPSQLHCDVAAETLLEAVALVAEEIRKINGLRAVRVVHEDIVTLDMAAQRTAGKRTRQSLVQLSKGQRGPGGFPQPEEKVGGTTFYSWPKIVDFLRALGDEIDQVPRDSLITDKALRLVDEIENADYSVPASVWKSLGLLSDSPPNE